MSQFKRRTRRNPCPICGHPDWCFSLPSLAGELSYCARAKNYCDIYGMDGSSYVFLGKTQKSFSIYEEYSQHENFEEMKREYGRTQNGNNQSYEKHYTKREFRKVELGDVNSDHFLDEELYPLSCKILSDDKLDAFYRAFLDKLVLEEKDEIILREEWGELADKVFELYPIKSLPMTDLARKTQLANPDVAKLKNPWRKDLMAELMEDFETAVGIPGLYEPEDGVFDFSSLSGIIFPVFNEVGQIIRLRIKDATPRVKGEFNHHVGEYFCSKKGHWLFKPDDYVKYNDQHVVIERKSFNPELVFGYSGTRLIKKISLNKGLPPGEVSGKYKNFSSYAEGKDEEGNDINLFRNGTRSGSMHSIYYPNGDYSNTNFPVIYFTEGEKKAIIASIILNAPVVCVPGVGMYDLIFERGEKSTFNVLKQRGMIYAVLCYDADKATNEAVLNHECGFVSTVKENGCAIYVGGWDARFGKGFDDILLSGLSIIMMPYVMPASLIEGEVSYLYLYEKQTPEYMAKKLEIALQKVIEVIKEIDEKRLIQQKSLCH